MSDRQQPGAEMSDDRGRNGRKREPSALDLIIYGVIAIAFLTSPIILALDTSHH